MCAIISSNLTKRTTPILTLARSMLHLVTWENRWRPNHDLDWRMLMETKNWGETIAWAVVWREKEAKHLKKDNSDPKSHPSLLANSKRNNAFIWTPRKIKSSLIGQESEAWDETDLITQRSIIVRTKSYEATVTRVRILVLIWRHLETITRLHKCRYSFSSSKWWYKTEAQWNLLVMRAKPWHKTGHSSIWTF